jgi:hypothetical protein
LNPAQSAMAAAGLRGDGLVAVKHLGEDRPGGFGGGVIIWPALPKDQVEKNRHNLPLTPGSQSQRQAGQI